MWNVRRYCQPITDPKVYESLNGPEAMRNRHNIRLDGGFLESVLIEARKRKLRVALVWKNGCFGSRSRESPQELSCTNCFYESGPV